MFREIVSPLEKWSQRNKEMKTYDKIVLKTWQSSQRWKILFVNLTDRLDSTHSTIIENLTRLIVWDDII